MIRRPLSAAVTAAVLLMYLGRAGAVESPETAGEWYSLGAAIANKNRATAEKAIDNVVTPAKNIILFVGDGMGISTVTAARILDGQNKGMAGEENLLFFEAAPNLALSKTYNTNQQTPDSAGTMTAMMSGIKTKAGVIGVNQNVVRSDCSNQADNEAFTALEMAEVAGMSTGVVTTARITHATPAATYAHVMDRNFEDDRDAGGFSNPAGCADIASQLIDFPTILDTRIKKATGGIGFVVDGLDVAMGGGRRSFLKREDGADPEGGGKGERQDGRDLTQEWLAKYSNARYVWNRQQFDAIDPATTDHLLGLFEMSHMEYEADRETDTGGEPALHEMTAKAIDILSKNPKGFFLMVESGRIDHAHHATNPYRALTDTIELDMAVRTAFEKTDPSETLIIVTADHSHVFTIAGYPTRGNPILGKVVSNDEAGNPETEATQAADGLPYTTLGYINGRGFNFLPIGGDAIYSEDINLTGRADLTDIDTTNQGFHPETLVPLSDETHAAEDVAIYAVGPGSDMVNGVMEQHAIFHVMNKAGHLLDRAVETLVGQ
ncbi:MAG: alkaline phosphatase [Gammaproteobacteria bacterium]